MISSVLTAKSHIGKLKLDEAKSQKLTQKHFRIQTTRQASSLVPSMKQMMRKPIRSMRVSIMRWTSAERPVG